MAYNICVMNLTKNGVETQSLESYLFNNNRQVYLNGEVNSASANDICMQLRVLEAMDADKEIFLIINSPGGSVIDGLAIVDQIKHSKAPIITVVHGLAASMGAVILSAGKRRLAYKNSEVLIHQVLGGAGGQASDVEIQARHMLATKEKLNRLLAENTGHSYEEICKDTDRDYWLDAEAALAYGIIDEIVKED